MFAGWNLGVVLTVGGVGGTELCCPLECRLIGLRSPVEMAEFL
jgi:hypothetical protein